jgi:D-alanyl-D-alanine carboxypeptidase (penicillin-binding protein 5/6)
MKTLQPLLALRILLAATLCAMCSCETTPDAAAASRRGSGEAYIVVDFHSKKILSSRNAGDRRQVASLTKIATAMVALDWAAATGVDLSQQAVVPASAMAIGGPNQMGLRPGDRMSLRDALYCAIIGSDNWAAETIANHVGTDLLQRSRGIGRNTPTSEFVKQMNYLAKKQGAESTKFTNAHGMDNLKPTPYSSAADIARLAIYAMGKPSFTFFCSQGQRKVNVLTPAGPREFVIKNTNKLLGTDDIDGVKTGLTRLAGGCLAISSGKDSIFRELPDGRTKVTPRRMVVVVLGSSDRFGMSRSLLARGWEKFAAWDAAGRVVRDPGEILNMPKE